MADNVLLTGISGFLGGQTALALLNAGFNVRGSLRSLSKADAVRETLAKAGADTSRLEFVALDLLADDGWTDAMRDVRYLVHTASPFVLQMPTDKMDLIRPAVEGTERAITAGLSANVERIVLTSSMAAMAYGHGPSRTAPFTSTDWTNLDGGKINAYIESKTLAERKAWELVRAVGREADLVAINPGVILGPLLDDDAGTSVTVIQRLMNGSIPAAPRLPMVTVDVRDVAAAHVRALIAPEAGGRRFPMGEATLYLQEMAGILRDALPAESRKAPRFELPDWAVRLYAIFDSDVRSNIGELGVAKRLDSTDVVELLGRPLIPSRDAIIASAKSLVEQGLI